MRIASLNRQVSFQQILPMLGSTAKSHALPTVATCPVCRTGRLTIALDNSVGGEWAYCSECKFTGDMITLASKVWKLGIRLTIRRLAMQPGSNPELNDVRAVNGYETDHHAAAVRVAEFWQQCQASHVRAETATLRMLQRRFDAHNVGDEWPSRAGLFIGSTNKREIDATFTHKTFANWENSKTKNSGSFSSYILRGPKWSDVLAVPYWDMPGRICGFLFIGREVNPETDFVYKGLLDGIREGGLAMLPAVMGGIHQRFGQYKFIFTDPEIAMRFHVRHSKDHNKMLPLAATWHGPSHVTREVWDWFHSNHLIFWGPDPLKSIHQARLAKGKVSTLKVPDIEMQSNMRSYSPESWLERMRIAALPWNIALQDYLADLDDTTIEETFLLLDLGGRDLDEFIATCRPGLRERLEFVRANKNFADKVKFEGHWIFEKTDGWYLSRNDERISNVIVHIDHVLTTIDNRSYYRGIIKFNGEVYPFTEKVATLDKGMFSWAQAYLRDHVRAGVSEYYPSWNKKSVQLAIMFSKPKHIQGIDVIGWDAINQQFNFPQFAIRKGGEVVTDFACLFDSARLPARGLPSPGLIPRRHIAALSERHDESQIFWATAACVAANIVASAVNRNQLPTILSGDGAIGVGSSAAVRLGCLEIMTDIARNKRGYPSKLQPELKGIFGWPSVVPITGPQLRTDWLDQEHAKHCIFGLSTIAGKAIAMRGRANLIVHPRKLGSLQLLFDAAPYVLPNYMQDLYRRNIFLPDEHPDLATDVLHDMAEWFSQLNGDPVTVTDALQIMHTPHSKSASDYFCELVFQLFEAGVLSTGLAAYDKIDASTAITQITGNENLVWISQDRFSDAVKLVGGVAPDLLLISKSLADAGILVSEPAYQQVQGWLVRESWWNLKLETWRAKDDDQHDAMAG